MWQPNKLEKERLEKVERLEEQQVALYPPRVKRSHSIAQAISDFEEKEKAKQDYLSTGKELAEDDTTYDVSVTVTGRIRRLNVKGKVSFMHIEDETGRVQLFLRVNNLDEASYELVKRKLIDVDDFVQATGIMMRTQAGEISVNVSDFVLLSKSLSPLPVIKERELEDGTIVEYGEFKDVESRYRQRYADLAVNRTVRETFRKRTMTVHAIREFLDNEGMLEVETPILQPIYGGAAARPFVTHHNQLHQELYLRISFELYLKRLLVGGFDAVYEIGRDFRNEGVSFKHNTEFTMLEFYKAYIDYEGVMDITERMLAYTAEKVTGGTTINFKSQEINLAPSWRRVSIRDLVQETLGFDYMDYPDAESLYDTMKERGLDDNLNLNDSWGRMIVENLLGIYCEPKLIQPTIVKDYPREMSPFAKRIQGNPSITDKKEQLYISTHTERFEFFISGMEMGNAFTELNDARDQQDRFVEMKRLYADESDDATPLDEDYLRAMRYGMPPNGGFGMGVDRLVMLLTDQESIRDVLLYPHLRAEAPSESDLRAQMMLDAAVRGYEYQLDVQVDDKKRTVGLMLPKLNAGIEFRMPNALEGSLPELERIADKYEGVLFVYTGEAFYRVGDKNLKALSVAEFWNSLI